MSLRRARAAAPDCRSLRVKQDHGRRPRDASGARVRRRSWRRPGHRATAGPSGRLTLRTPGSPWRTATPRSSDKETWERRMFLFAGDLPSSPENCSTGCPGRQILHPPRPCQFAGAWMPVPSAFTNASLAAKRFGEVGGGQPVVLEAVEFGFTEKCAAQSAPPKRAQGIFNGRAIFDHHRCRRRRITASPGPSAASFREPPRACRRTPRG